MRAFMLRMAEKNARVEGDGCTGNAGCERLYFGVISGALQLRLGHYSKKR